MKTQVVNIHKEPYDIYIGRPSIYGNPFIIGKDGTKKEIIAKFRNYFYNNPNLQEQVFLLKGKRLGCYCKPNECHGDVYVEFLNSKMRM